MIDGYLSFSKIFDYLFIHALFLYLKLETLHTGGHTNICEQNGWNG